MKSKRAKKPGAAAAKRPAPRQARVMALWPGAAAAALVAVVYLAAAGGGSLLPGQSGFPHHVLIADAWLHGQTNVREEILEERSAPFYQRYRANLERRYRAQGRTLTDAEWSQIRPRLKPKAMHDWTVWNGKYYGYWGPTPAALLLPFVAVAGPDASDRLVSCLLGAATVFFIFLLLREVGRLGFVPVTPTAAVAIALLFGLGTVNFYLAVMGQVWFLSQVVGAFFLSVAAWAVLRTDRGIAWAIAAGGAFGAAVLARNSILLTAPFFGGVLYAIHGRAAGGPLKDALRLAAAFLAPVAVSGVLMLAYNQARFGDPFDSGVEAQIRSNANPRFRSDYETYGSFHPHYLSRNLYYYFINPMLRRQQSTGAITFDPYGNSMFLVTPALLFALAAARRRDLFTLSVWAGVLPCLAALLLFFGTGWFNFGNRYLLDLLPLAILLVAIGMRGRLTNLSAALIALSVLVNAWGTYRFSVEQF